MVILKPRRRARHAGQPAARQAPVTVPPPGWARPLFGWLEARAQGVQMDPQHDAAMAALHSRYRSWRDQEGGRDAS